MYSLPYAGDIVWNERGYVPVRAKSADVIVPGLLASNRWMNVGQVRATADVKDRGS